MTRNLTFLALTLSTAACLVVAQDKPRPQPSGDGIPRPHLLPPGSEESLELTSEQRDQLATLESEMRTKIEHLLTPAQVEKMKTMRPPARGGRDQHERRNPAPDTSASRDERPHQVATGTALQPLAAGVTRLSVTFSGGHDTVPVDHGRPVVLIAAALGVKDEVFRDAFSRVHPAGPGSGGPSRDEAQANKRVLMDALGKYGITNDRLDTVSNFYRYAAWNGGIWKNEPATANALIKDGAIIGFEITSGGYGYTTPPKISVQGMNDVSAKVKLGFNQDTSVNGSVSEITIAAAN